MKKREKIIQTILKIVKPNTKCLFNLAPRFGKTKLALQILNKLKPTKILWVSPTRKLLEEDLPKEMKKWNLVFDMDKTTYASLNKVKGEYDVIILDEYHFLTKNNAANLLNGSLNGRAIIGLSGTHPDKREKKELLANLGLYVCMKYSIQDAIKDGILSNYKIKVYPIKLSDKKNIKTKKGFYTSEKNLYDYYTKKMETAKFEGNYKEMRILGRLRYTLLSNSETKFRRLLELKEDYKEQRNIYFLGNIKHAELIAPSYNSKSKDKEVLKLFEEEKLNELALVNVGGTGFTFKNVDNLFLTTVNNNSIGHITQKLARVLLKDEKIPTLHIIYFENTVEEKWLVKSLKEFAYEKIIQQRYY